MAGVPSSERRHVPSDSHLRPGPRSAERPDRDLHQSDPRGPRGDGPADLGRDRVGRLALRLPPELGGAAPPAGYHDADRGAVCGRPGRGPRRGWHLGARPPPIRRTPRVARGDRTRGSVPPALPAVVGVHLGAPVRRALLREACLLHRVASDRDPGALPFRRGHGCRVAPSPEERPTHRLARISALGQRSRGGGLGPSRK